MSKPIDSGSSVRSANSTAATYFTYYKNYSDKFAPAQDVTLATGLTNAAAQGNLRGYTVPLTSSSRISKGVPVVTGKYSDTANGVTDYIISDVVPKASGDSGFYKDQVSGQTINTTYKYINTPITIPGTDGKPIYYKGYYVPTVLPNSPGSISTDAGSTDGTQITDSTENYQWNLPPHKWSMPFVSSKNGMAIERATRSGSSDRYRRGRIWSAYAANTYTLTTDAKGNQVQNWSKSNKSKLNYGFQFMWNPEALSTAVAVQMDATPNVNDQWLGAVGLFPATETFSINIRLDRTNDFARAGARFGRPTKLAKEDSGSNDFVKNTSLSDLLPEYQVKGGFSQKGVKLDDLKDLFNRGTLADLEYLFRAVNGKGPTEDTPWVNPRGQETANIGWLQPNLVHIDVGPLSYIGWITNIGITHTSFTQDMIPIRTDVSISFNTLATAGIGSAAADASAASATTTSTTTQIPTLNNQPAKPANYSALLGDYSVSNQKAATTATTYLSKHKPSSGAGKVLP